MSHFARFNNRSLVVFITFCLLSICFYYSSLSATSESTRRSLQTSQRIQTKRKLILITKWWGSEYIYEWENVNKVCSNQCFFTTDMSAWNKSSAIIFHGNNHEFLRQNLTRPSPEQIWIWLNLEPSSGFTSNSQAVKHLQFNWTLSYRRDSDIVSPYSRIFPVDKIPKRMQIIKDFESKTTYQLPSKGIPSVIGFSDRKMAAWIVSHCETWSKRESLVAEMQKTIHVDIYGFCGPKKCKNSRAQQNECRLEIHQNYKFYLAFENALCEDYVTEKFFDTLKLEMIPVVYGSAEYSRAFPPNSFINVLDYKSVSELTDHMIYLSENPAEWLKYFEWKKYFVVMHSTYLPAYCDVCDKLFSQDEEYPIGVPSKSYKDVVHWWLSSDSTEKAVCKSDEEVQHILTTLQVKS